MAFFKSTCTYITVHWSTDHCQTLLRDWSYTVQLPELQACRHFFLKSRVYSSNSTVDHTHVCAHVSNNCLNLINVNFQLTMKWS